MKAIILAAGYATRLYPLTENLPKALLTIGGKTILDHLMSKIHQIGAIDEAHIISNHRFADCFRKWADEARVKYPSLALRVWDDGTSSNETRLGAIGDIRFVIEKAGLDDDTLIAASDNFFTFSLLPFYDDFIAHKRDLLLAHPIESVEERRRYAIAEIDPEGRVLSLIEKPSEPKGYNAILAIYLYRRDTMKLFRTYLDEGNNPDAPGHFPEWLYKRKEVRAFITDEDCVDIGTVETYRRVQKEHE